MQHVLLFYDFVEDYLTRREAYRTAHLSHAWKAVERGELVLGGALTDPADTGVLLFQGDKAAAEDFARSDPYVTHGLVRAWSVRVWTTVVGEGAARPLRVTES